MFKEPAFIPVFVCVGTIRPLLLSALLGFAEEQPLNVLGFNGYSS